jgi:hypothetical protein
MVNMGERADQLNLVLREFTDFLHKLGFDYVHEVVAYNDGGFEIPTA